MKFLIIGNRKVDNATMTEFETFVGTKWRRMWEIYLSAGGRNVCWARSFGLLLSFWAGLPGSPYTRYRRLEN